MKSRRIRWWEIFFPLTMKSGRSLGIMIRILDRYIDEQLKEMGLR